MPAHFSVMLHEPLKCTASYPQPSRFLYIYIYIKIGQPRFPFFVLQFWVTLYNVNKPFFSRIFDSLRQTRERERQRQRRRQGVRSSREVRSSENLFIWVCSIMDNCLLLPKIKVVFLELLI